MQDTQDTTDRASAEGASLYNRLTATRAGVFHYFDITPLQWQWAAHIQFFTDSPPSASIIRIVREWLKKLKLTLQLPKPILAKGVIVSKDRGSRKHVHLVMTAAGLSATARNPRNNAFTRDCHNRTKARLLWIDKPSLWTQTPTGPKPIPERGEIYVDPVHPRTLDYLASFRNIADQGESFELFHSNGDRLQQLVTRARTKASASEPTSPTLPPFLRDKFAELNENSATCEFHKEKEVDCFEDQFFVIYPIGRKWPPERIPDRPNVFTPRKNAPMTFKTDERLQDYLETTQYQDPSQHPKKELDGSEEPPELQVRAK